MTVTDTGYPALPSRAPAAFGAFPFGFGVFPLSGEARPSEDDAVQVVLAALETGVRFLDTADSYHPIGHAVGYGETLVARALRLWSGDAGEVLVGTKGSRILQADGDRVSDGRPSYLKAAAAASLARLGGDALGLYQLHRPDPAVPYADSLGAMKEIHDAGDARYLGISNANPAQILLAVEILGEALISVQNQFGPGFLSSEPELELCEELGLLFLPWSAFGGADPEVSLDVAFPALARVAGQYGVSWQRIVLAWLRSQGSVVFPIPGARRLSSLTDSLAASSLEVDGADLAALDAAFRSLG